MSRRIQKQNNTRFVALLCSYISLIPGAEFFYLPLPRQGQNLKICTTTSIERKLMPNLLLKRFFPSEFTISWIYNELSVIYLYQSCASAGSQPHTRSSAQPVISAFPQFFSFVIRIYSELMNQTKILHTYLSAFQKGNLHFGNGQNLVFSQA